MLTRLIQRTDTVSEGSIEYEYRDAEYEKKQSLEGVCNLIAEHSTIDRVVGRAGFEANDLAAAR